MFDRELSPVYPVPERPDNDDKFEAPVNALGSNPRNVPNMDNSALPVAAGIVALLDAPVTSADKAAGRDVVLLFVEVPALL
jgi:hypothetical protein